MPSQGDEIDRRHRRLAAVEPLAAPAIAAPPADQIVTTPMRAREVDDRNTLLKGIAPPERKAVPDDEAPGPTP